MGHIYSVPFEDITVAAADTPFDLISIVAPSTSKLRLWGAQITQVSDVGDAAAGALRVTFNRYASQGTGGTSVTPVALNPLAPASAFTAKRGTALGTTATLVQAFAFNVQAGFYWDPIPELTIWVAPSAVFCITMPEDGTGTAASVDLSGFLLVEEV